MADAASLSGQAQCVLATGILAKAWPEEFPDGWVGMTEVIRYSKHGANEEDDATRQAFYRSRQQLEQRLPGLSFEDKVAGRAKIRISGSLPAALHDWLYDHGSDFIKSEEWDRFVAARVHPPETPEEADARFQATAARVLVMQGRTDEALQLLREALRQPRNLRQEMALRLAWTFAIVRTGRIRDFKGAYRVLSELASRELPPGDVNDRLLKARLHVELAYCRYLAEVMGRRDPQRIKPVAEECHELLSQARKFQAGLSPSDQGRLENVTALFTKARAIASDGEERDRLFAEARHGFLRSFGLAESVDDAYAMAAALYNLGELCYARDRLELMSATVEQATEALSWFKQSVGMAERLGITRDLYLDYARIADVLGVLMLARLRRGDREGLAALMAEAEWHLTQAKTHGNRLEQKLARWTDGRLSEVARRAGIKRHREQTAA